MKRLLPLILALSFSSCEKIKEEALYNKYDDDWDLVQQLIASQCQNESEIFQELQKRRNFSKYYDENTYYEIEIKRANGANYKAYLKVLDVTTTNIEFSYYDPSNTDPDANFTFSDGQYDNLLTAISNGICSSDDDFEYSHSSLDSDDKLDFTDRRETGDDDAYEKLTDKYSVNVDIPLPFVIWSRTLESKKKLDGQNEQDPKTDTWAIKEITSDDCDKSDCQNAGDWRTGYSSGGFTIDTNAYTDNSLNSLFYQIN